MSEVPLQVDLNQSLTSPSIFSILLSYFRWCCNNQLFSPSHPHSSLWWLLFSCATDKLNCQVFIWFQHSSNHLNSPLKPSCHIKLHWKWLLDITTPQNESCVQDVWNHSTSSLYHKSSRHPDNSFKCSLKFHAFKFVSSDGQIYVSQLKHFKPCILWDSKLAQVKPYFG